MNFHSRTNTKNRNFKVSDEYRTNPLSHEPGGSTVIVFYQDGTSREYDKVKNVKAYTRYMLQKYDVARVQRKEAELH